MTRFAALGDSITLGVGDPVRPARPAGPAWADRPVRGRRGWRGWAALLAEGLNEPGLHNLAVNGACMADVERDQLPRALQLRPDIASVVVGVNDTLRPNFDPDRYRGGGRAHGRRAARGGRRGAHHAAARSRAGCSACRACWPARWPGAPASSTWSWTPWPSASARCTLTRPGTPRHTTRGCGRRTGCTPANEATGSLPAGITACSPRPDTRSDRRLTPSRPARRPPGWPS